MIISEVTQQRLSQKITVHPLRLLTSVDHQLDMHILLNNKSSFGGEINRV